MATSSRSLARGLGVLLAGVLFPSSVHSLQAQSPPEWRLTPDLRIDGVTNDLTMVHVMTVARDGAIVISQNQDGPIRFFDERGAAQGTFGRKGQGPGEFQFVSGFTWIGDTLVVTDRSSRRFTLVSPDRKLVHTVPWIANVIMTGASPPETPRFRSALARVRLGEGSQIVAASFADGSPAPNWPGGMRDGAPLLRVDSTGAVRNLILWKTSVNCTEPFDPGGGGFGFIGIPFCAAAMEDISADGGRVAIVDVEQGGGPRYRVTLARSNGDTVFSRAYTYRPVTIPQSSRDSARATRMRGNQREAAARMKIPESYPPVLTLLLGRDETTWLELAPADKERTWLVLDARGTVAGAVRLPKNIRILVASRDAVWAMEADDNGLESVVRFRVSR